MERAMKEGVGHLYMGSFLSRVSDMCDLTSFVITGIMRE